MLGLSGWAQVAVRLIQAKGMVNDQQDAGGVTYVLLCILHPQAALLDMLLKRGANPNIRSNDGNYPVTLCLRQLGR